MKSAPLPRWWWWATLAIAALGALVRYHDLSRQIVLDDEWHSLAYASSHDAWSLATTYYPNATSIPVNVYHRLLLLTWGWSEVSIRLLSVAASLAALAIVPWTVARVFRAPTLGLVAGLLFAGSPFWIFYGASARPYAAFFALLLPSYYFLERALARGEHEGSTRSYDWLLFGLAGALAVWFHLYALPTIAALVVLPAARVARELRAHGFRSMAWREPLRVGLLGFGSWTALVLLLYGLPASRGMSDKLPTPTEPRGFDLTSLREMQVLVSGARAEWLAWLLCLAAAGGLWLAAKKNARFVLLLGLGLAGSFAFTLLLKPEQYYVAIVTCRYNITLFLLYFVGLAALLDRVLSVACGWLSARAPRVSEAAFAGALLLVVAVALATVTPVAGRALAGPNNFRLHSAFQESYVAWDPSRGYHSSFFGDSALSLERMPGFYQQLSERKKPCRIVEYPLPKRDHENPFYFYQLHHGCEVVAGYAAGDATSERLGAEAHRDRLRFSWLVDMQTLRRSREGNADFLVIHTDPRAEARGGRRRPSRETKRLLTRLKRKLGSPDYRDPTITVFSLKSEKP